MEISQIESVADLINFFNEEDANRNGLLETDETENVLIYDTDGNQALSPWEVMEAVNLQMSVRIFRPDEVAASRYFIVHSRQLNDTGESGFDECGQRIEDSRNIRYFTYGSVLFHCRLPAPCSMASSYPASFHSNGRLSFAKLAEDSTIEGIAFWDGTEIGFYESGHPEWANLYRDTYINGMVLPARSTVHFYENGVVSSAMLAQDSEYVNGEITFGGGTIEFYESGQVKSGWLAERKTIQGIPFAANTLLNFYENGCVSSVYFGHLRSGLQINGVSYISGVDFYQNGNVSRGLLAGDTIIEGRVFKGGTRIEFYESGRVSSGVMRGGLEDRMSFPDQ